MDRQQGHEVLWMQIAKRIEMGEKQKAIAQELGMKPGKFRYQLRKFLMQQQEVEAGTAATAESSRTEESCLAPKKPLYDETLFDESWTRRWSGSRLVLLVKEPTTVHAYWEVDEQKRHLVAKHFQSRFEHLPFYLRLYDVTNIDFDGINVHPTETIQVHSEIDNWYVHSARPLRRYLMDFGTTTLSGNFFTILRSNIVQTPPEPRDRHLHGTNQFAPIARKSADEPVKSPVKTPALQSMDKLSAPYAPHAPRPGQFMAKQLVSIADTSEEQPTTGGAQLVTTSLRPYPNEFDGYSVKPGRSEPDA
jgi:uncharacterized protein